VVGRHRGRVCMLDIRRAIDAVLFV
jgi:hypothetical protein